MKNLPSNAGDMGLIPGVGPTIPHDSGKPNQSVTTTKSHALEHTPHNEDPAQPKKE